MRSEFFARVLLPHLVVAAAAVVLYLSVFLLDGTEGTSFLAGLALLAGTLLCWHWMVVELAAVPTTDGSVDPPPGAFGDFYWLPLAIWFFFPAVLLGVAARGSWAAAAVAYVAFDAITLSLVLAAGDAHDSFRRHVWPRLLQARREQEVAADRERVRRELEQFYDENAALLGDTCPPALYRARLQAALDDPTGAWDAARGLIEQLQPAVRDEHSRRRDEAARREQECKERERREAEEAEQRRGRTLMKPEDTTNV